GAYRGDGAFGQYCIVLPEQDAVIAITSGLRDMQAALNIVWDKLLPAFQSSPLPANAMAAAKLTTTLSSLTLPQPKNGDPSLVLVKKMTFPANDRKLESLTLRDVDKNMVTLDVVTAGETQRIACGKGTWEAGNFSWGPLPIQPAAASGAWT